MANYGSRINQTVGGAGQGALLGFEMGGPVGGIIGGGIGLLSGLFSESPQEQQQDAINRYIDAIEKMRTQRLTELNTAIAGEAGVATMGAKRRAISEGRGNQSESYIRPVQEGVYAQGNKATLAVNQEFDTMKAEALGTSPDIQPPISQTLGVLGNAYSQYKRDETLMDYVKGMRGGSGMISGNKGTGLFNSMQSDNPFDFNVGMDTEIPTFK